MSVVGIDPGKSGGIAAIGEANTAFNMPQTPGDLAMMFDMLRQDFGPIEHVYIEKVHAMPKQGVTSTFTFGFNFGMLIGMLALQGYPYTEVTPATWQKKMGCLSKGDKNITKNRAQQLFPQMKVTHATADALLIAEYGRRMEAGL